MKHVTNIAFSSIILIIILLGTSGVSVEKCSCTGKVSLTLPMDDGCCPGEGGCMTVKSMQLSDYMPTTAVNLDLPVMPMLFPVFPPVVPTFLNGYSTLCPYIHCAEAPPGDLAQTITVLRV
jgi:hypothetical protein